VIVALVDPGVTALYATPDMSGLAIFDLSPGFSVTSGFDPVHDAVPIFSVITFLLKSTDTGELHVPFGKVMVAVELFTTRASILNMPPANTVDGLVRTCRIFRPLI
jgi:hypothetical protein